MKAGDLTFTRPWQEHRVGDPHVGAGRLHCLILDVGVRRPHQTWRWPAWIVLTPDDLRQLTDILRHNEQPVWHATAEVAHCFRRIGAAVEADRDGSSISSLAVGINQLFLSVLEMFRRQEVRLDESLSSTRRTVELFWADLCQNPDHLALEWTVRGMARRCGMGVTNFIHHCRATGQHDAHAISQPLPVERGRTAAERAAGPKHHRHRRGLRLCVEPVFRHAFPPQLRRHAPGVPRRDGSAVDVESVPAFATGVASGNCVTRQGGLMRPAETGMLRSEIDIANWASGDWQADGRAAIINNLHPYTHHQVLLRE